MRGSWPAELSIVDMGIVDMGINAVTLESPVGSRDPSKRLSVSVCVVTVPAVWDARWSQRCFVVTGVT